MTKQEILEDIIANEEYNIAQLAKLELSEVNNLLGWCRYEQEKAEEQNDFLEYKLAGEKISQLNKAKEILLYDGDEASDWIHW